MDGEKTKYYKYKGTSGRLKIPPSIANALSWDHQEELRIVFKTIDGKKGLFIFKQEKENKDD